MGNTMKQKILLAVDGSEQALQAMRYTSRVMLPERMEVVLLHVMTKIPESFWDLEREPAYHCKIVNIRQWEQQQEKIIQDFMDSAQQLLLDAGFSKDCFRIDIRARQEGIARDIFAESQKGYDAVVLGRTGLSELKDLILGSIAHKLMERLTNVPIWIIGGSPRPGKILISLDTSDWALMAADYVGSVVHGSDAEILLFHAVRGFNIFQKGHGKSFIPEHAKDWLEQAEKELEEAGKAMGPVFDEATKRLVNAGVKEDKIKHKTVTGVSSRAGAIVAEAQQEGYDTIVVGRRGLSKVQEFFMGRVSNKVIQMARKMAVWVVS